MSYKVFFVIILSVIHLPGYGAKVVTGKDEQALLPYWELQTDAMKLRLVQRLPDQTRAYFSGRGFNKDDVDLISSRCFFQSIYANTDKGESVNVIDYNLRDWKIIYNGKKLPVMIRETWRDIWQARNTEQAQKIAMEWSLLPTRQTLKAADYNWGMTAYPLPHGVTFKLDIVWKINGKIKKASINNMKCADDVYIAPTNE